MNSTENKKIVEAIASLIVRCGQEAASCSGEPPVFSAKGAAAFFREQLGIDFSEEDVLEAARMLVREEDAMLVSKSRNLFRCLRTGWRDFPLFLSYNQRALRNSEK